MHPLLNIAIQAIRKAGNFVIKRYEKIDTKSLDMNYKKNFFYKTNLILNSIIINKIKQFYPIHSITTNPYNNSNVNNINTKIQWIIHPLDNNINFIKQLPYFSLAIAVKNYKHTIIEVIYDPIHNELFSAIRGKGAKLNGYRIRVSSAKNLYKTILAISYLQNKQKISTNFLNKLYSKEKNIDFRCTGVTTLDLAYVAVGRFDGCFFTIPIKKNNDYFISGDLIIKESGGMIIDLTNNQNLFSSSVLTFKNIIAGNPKIVKSIFSAINR